MFSFKEFKIHERTIALFLYQRMKRGDAAARQTQVQPMKAIVCLGSLADKDMITDRFQSSKLFPLKIFETKGCPG